MAGFGHKSPSTDGARDPASSAVADSGLRILQPMKYGHWRGHLIGRPGRIRTCDQHLIRVLLYR